MLGLGIECAEDFVRHDSDLLVALENGMTRDSGIKEAVSFDGAIQVGIVISLLRGIA